LLCTALHTTIFRRQGHRRSPSWVAGVLIRCSLDQVVILSLLICNLSA
jgi:hypothetical protein